MLHKIFSTAFKAKLIILGIGVLWFLGLFFLLQIYEIEFWIRLTDAFLFTLVFLSGLTIIEKIFTFYAPKSENLFLLFLIPFIFGFVETKAHFYALQFIFEYDTAYQDFLETHLWIRVAFLTLTKIAVALLALVVSKLAQQEEFRSREIWMNELAKEAELNQLKQQLQPHFLFNSLNSIHALVINEPQKAREMVLQLSDFLRATIRKDHQKWLGLEEELSHLKIYLDIERVRFGHRLEVEFLVEEPTKQMIIPQILIQPLVENALKHGLYGVLGQVKIEIHAWKTGTYLHVKISNPMDSSFKSNKGLGFGLSSIERRLLLLFGRSDLMLISTSINKFTIELKIPQPK